MNRKTAFIPAGVLAAAMTLTSAALAEAPPTDMSTSPPRMPMMYGQPGGIPMMGYQHGGMPMTGAQQGAASANRDPGSGMPMQGCRHGGNPMMGQGPMMAQRQEMMQRHMRIMQQRLANIEALLQRLVQLQQAR